MTEPNAKAREIIDSLKFMTVATVDDNGQPWNTPVACYHFKDDYTMYWASWRDNQHSKNIRANGKVFIVIYDSTPIDNQVIQGVYIRAEAAELTDPEEISQAAKVFANDPYNPSEGKEYSDGKPRRIYKATPLNIWLNDDSKIGDDFIDTRIAAEG